MLHALLDSAQRLEGIGGKVDRIALDLCGLQDVLSERAEVALYFLAVAAVVSQTAAPQTGVVFDAIASFSANGAFFVSDGGGLPPLVVDLAGVVLGHYELAVGFPQFRVPTYPHHGTCISCG